MESGHELRLIPLGGLGEFGLNAMVLEWQRHLLLLDAGVMFASAEMPGVEKVVPDFEYLAARREGLRGILLTHERVRAELRRFFKRRTQRRPMVIPVVMEV